ncbi:hypothetical protein AB0D04_04235 [Streptomyces sp. NPDC048483]|uniref:hypothetical protein n=1 Tax=Streptomyces sp. NPDC048483 TaxID=3154927 RepID=UPI00341EAC7F
MRFVDHAVRQMRVPGAGDGDEEAVGAFLVAGGDAAPSLETVEAAFDDIAAPGDGFVEAAPALTAPCPAASWPTRWGTAALML